MTTMPSALFVNHEKEACGVHEFGLSVFEALRPSTKVSFQYADVANEAQLHDVVAERRPSVVILNYHPSVMPWINRSVVRAVDVPVIGIVHEFDYVNAFSACADLFDFRVLPDPTCESQVPGVFTTPRLVPDFEPGPMRSDQPILGSFGFPAAHKGFERVVKLACQEFDRATVRLWMSRHFSQSVQKDASDIAERCKNAVTKPGISLELQYGFLGKPDLLRFLAENTVNVFFFDDQPGRGLSSSVDLAVAVGRPVAVSDSRMFRHLRAVSPVFCLDKTPLQEIIDKSGPMVQDLRRSWTPDKLRAAYENAVAETLELARTSTEPTYNTLLIDYERERYAGAVAEISALAPETIRRKIPRANVQQAFVKEAVQNFAREFRDPKILCVGSYEDTACESLKKLGLRIEEIDPVVNMDLNEFCTKPTTMPGSYHVIFSTSVLEHVPDDEEFMERIGDLLAPGGVAVLTADFNRDYKPGGGRPAADERLYTPADLLGRLLCVLDRCDLVDRPLWLDAPADFEYEGFWYSFATLTFRKRSLAEPESGFWKARRLQLAAARLEVLRSSRRQLASMLAEQRRLDDERNALLAANAELKHSVQVLSERVDQITSDVGSLSETISKIRTSISWRITQPLRNLMRKG